MTLIREDVSLKPYNTFGIEASCRYFVELHSADDFSTLLRNDIYIENSRLIIGGGSNILLTGDFEGIVIKNSLKGIEIVSETENEVTVKVAAGEVWHDFVLWCIGKNLGGVENLSLIPGCVGASPMQNIGAYGVEIKQVFVELEALDLQSGHKKIFSREACEFGYRDSVFKNRYKEKYLITQVTYKLSKQSSLNTSYGAIEEEMRKMNVMKPGIRDVSNAVIAIRRSKLPDPAVVGNAGSFFKNPEVSATQYRALKALHDQLVAYPLENGRYKLAAGWLIEQCGLKGYVWKGAAVHLKQALVLVNNNNCKGSDVLELSEQVMRKVLEKFGVNLEREVNIVA